MKSRLTTFFLYLTLTILVILLGLIFFLVYKSYSYKSQTAVIISETESIVHRNTSLTSVREALDDAESYMQTVGSRFIKEQDIPDFIGSIEALGEEKSVTANIISVSLDKPDPKAPVQTSLRSLKVRIDGSGLWSDSMMFISALESLPSALSVQSVSLSKSPGGTPETANFWRFTVDIVQYVAN